MRRTGLMCRILLRYTERAEGEGDEDDVRQSCGSVAMPEADFKRFRRRVEGSPGSVGQNESRSEPVATGRGIRDAREPQRAAKPPTKSKGSGRRLSIAKGERFTPWQGIEGDAPAWAVRLCVEK